MKINLFTAPRQQIAFRLVLQLKGNTTGAQNASCAKNLTGTEKVYLVKKKRERERERERERKLTKW